MTHTSTRVKQILNRPLFTFFKRVRNVRVTFIAIPVADTRTLQASQKSIQSELLTGSETL
jgi:hypothetical protein